MAVRTVPIALSLALAAAALGGCGFTPLYATPGVVAGMSSIQVNVPHGRTAFLLGEDLNDDLARDLGKPPTYRLDLTVVEKRYPRGLKLDNTADRYETHVTVGYSLVEIDNGKVLKTGAEPIEVSYAASGYPYAGIVAQQDAQKRAAEEAAHRITIDLGVYFASLAAR
ncbi:MAG: LPS assembly lipoprotein LptE [Caulobacteraceae bacterium]|nr:LPS assembly lipoprotein LptE [Caulobacteraceae bacterium]